MLLPTMRHVEQIESLTVEANEKLNQVLEADSDKELEELALSPGETSSSSVDSRRDSSW